MELLIDIDMILEIEKGIRGGVAQVPNRHSKANNKYMGEVYNPSQSYRYLMYRGIRVDIPVDQFYNLNIPDLPNDPEIGYILEADIKYPPELHKDLPLCPSISIIKSKC